MLSIQNVNMTKKTSALRAYLKAGTFLHMPAVYDPLGARLVEQAGFEAAYVGGYVTGGSQAITEPLLTMTEQIDVAEAVASSIDIPVLADAGAGFGEPLHTMRAIREFIRTGIAGRRMGIGSAGGRIGIAGRIRCGGSSGAGCRIRDLIRAAGGRAVLHERPVGFQVPGGDDGPAVVTIGNGP